VPPDVRLRGPPSHLASGPGGVGLAAGRSARSGDGARRRRGL